MNIVVINNTSAWFYSVKDSGQAINHGKINCQHVTGLKYSFSQKSKNKMRQRKYQEYINNCVEKIEKIFGKSIKDKTLYLAGPDSTKIFVQNALPDEWKRIMVDVQYGGDNGFFQAIQEIENYKE